MATPGKKLQDLLQEISRSDRKRIKSVIKKVSNVMKNNIKLRVSETWVCGSAGKHTNIKGTSDIDLVFVLSPKQNIRDKDKLFAEVRRTLKPISSINPTTSYKATKIIVSELEVDVLITKIGAIGKIGEAQTSMRHVLEIINNKGMFANVVRILKYWKVFPNNVPKKGYISSFQIEIILLHIFKKKKPKKQIIAIKEFFHYIVDSKLNNQLAFPPRKKPLLQMNFTFKKKEEFVNRSRHALGCLNKNPIDLSFLGL